jgi:arylsulfatase A-like enzyme
MNPLKSLLLASALFLGLWDAPARNAKPLNIVLILTDDQGSIDLNCYGAKDLSTPHLDALAESGVRFTQFYVGAPVCSPSRASLLTGRFPIRAGVPGNVSSQPGHEGMPTEEVTIAEMLKASGYKTALFGKWHLGTVPQCEPLGQGFDHFLGHKGGCIDNYSHFFYWSGPNRHDLWKDDTEYFEEDGTHFSDILLREARSFISENREDPFFLYLPMNVPHYPVQPRLRYREMMSALSEPRASYAALVADIDHTVGELIDHIDSLGIRENTLIVYLSDHGHSTEERTGFGGGNAGPFRGAKFSLLEGGIRVPCIASLPGTIPAGEVRDQMATSLDWLPTFAELAGATLPDRKIDGSSLAAVLHSEQAPSPHEVFHWQLQDQWAVREGPWKLVVNGLDTDHRVRLEGEDKVFLSHLDRDATETKNLAREHTEVVDRLTRLHEEWAKEFETQ